MAVHRLAGRSRSGPPPESNESPLGAVRQLASGQQHLPEPADLRVLAAMVGDDPVVIALILQAFWDSALQARLELQGGAAACDMGAVSDAAHKLKSAARSIGAERLGAICALTEEASRAGRSPALDDLLQRFDAELSSVRHFLEALPAPAGGACP